MTTPTGGHEERGGSPAEVAALLQRSHRLGADPRNTNWAGGNASVKARADDPVSGAPAELLWVKGSGGDLGTLTEAGLAVLRLDRLRALVDVYPGVEREDEMQAAFDFCLHGRGGAVPSIDTAMHGLVDAPHVDHLHPDSCIALAAAADGEALTKECFGGRVVWVPWRRPGFQLGLDVAAIQQASDQVVGVVLGGHGITAWGSTSEECEARSLEIIGTAARFLAERGRAEPFGPVVDGYRPLPEAERHARAAELFPVLRGLASTDRRQVGCYSDAEVVLDFLARAGHPALAALGSSCPDHFLRTKVRPLVLDLPPGAPLQRVVGRLRELHAAYRDDYQAYYRRHATEDSPAMRGADPAIVLVPGVGMFTFGADRQTARVAGEFWVNAVNAMRGAEAVSTYAPIPESEKFRIEYWALEEAKLARRPKPKPLAGRVALVTGAGSGIGRAIAGRLAAEGACVAVSDRDGDSARVVAGELGEAAPVPADAALAVTADVGDEHQVAAAFRQAALAFGGVDLVVNNAGLSLSKPLLETTTADWDLQHEVMARGSFLVSREAARLMTRQGLGGDIVYVVSKNAVFAGRDNLAYGAAKADQAHQVRLLATELGEHGIRVNGVNPDAVVQGSGIFAGGWGARRAALYGIAEEELGAFYARRTLLGLEVLPEHVAAAVLALTSGDLSRTTGLLIPVDAGVAAAFLR
jgi:rhamnulose-1-phosphate aldolase/alcohol dehydrogenase